MCNKGEMMYVWWFSPQFCRSPFLLFHVGEDTQERRLFYNSRSPLWIYFWLIIVFLMFHLVVGENTQERSINYYTLVLPSVS